MSSIVLSNAQHHHIRTLHFSRNEARISTVSFSFGSQVPRPKTSATRRARTVCFHAPPSETLYQVLGIAGSGSPASEIKKAYKQMARKYHPDVSPPGRADEYTRRFILVHDAYETLSNPHTRASYDRRFAAAFPFAFTTSQPQMDEKKEWKSRWEQQLDELKRRGGKREPNGRTSFWGARMRNQP